MNKNMQSQRPKKHTFSKIVKIGTMIAAISYFMKKAKNKKIQAEAVKNRKVAKMKMACKS